MEENKKIDPDNQSENNDTYIEESPDNSPDKPPKKPAIAPDGQPDGTPENIPEVDPGTAPAGTPETPPTTGDVIGPEINLPGTETPSHDIELPPKPQGPQRIDSIGAQQNTNATYRWTYGDEKRRMDKKRRSGAGVLTYAIIMTIAFALCFTMLLGVLLYENGTLNLGNIRTIFVHDADDGSGALSIPEIAQKVSPSVVGITVGYEDLTGTGVGSGIIMSADGYIATNYHVVEDGTSFIVTLADGTEYSAEVIGYDELSDLAVIKVDTTGFTAAEFGDSSMLIVGELAVAIGNPAGLEYAGTVTDGIISAINRNVKIYDDTGIMVKKMTLIQTNATVNPGNSGGPLINGYGQVIGIVSMKLANDYDGIGFAIPINGALTILNEIIATGSSASSSEIAQKRALIGITAGGVAEGAEITLDNGTTVTASITGVMVTLVNDGYDAAGKLIPGDIITQVDGKDVFTVYDVMDIVNNKYAGDSISVKFYHEGEYKTVTITLGSEN